ncbi:hypothetical protein DFH11DRAFT_1549359 [Phellopilus nigrolimitatus]|nr:hypothetical protein DFH11DRAFT_1549359 [Phellopilus nigrolimitatus]
MDKGIERHEDIRYSKDAENISQEIKQGFKPTKHANVTYTPDAKAEKTAVQIVETNGKESGDGEDEIRDGSGLPLFLLALSSLALFSWHHRAWVIFYAMPLHRVKATVCQVIVYAFDPSARPTFKPERTSDFVHVADILQPNVQSPLRH